MDLDGVLALIGEGGWRVVAQGYQSAREPRRHLLRRIEVTSGGYRYDANVRNIAAGGALIARLWTVHAGSRLVSGKSVSVAYASGSSGVLPKVQYNVKAQL